MECNYRVSLTFSGSFTATCFFCIPRLFLKNKSISFVAFAMLFFFPSELMLNSVFTVIYENSEKNNMLACFCFCYLPLNHRSLNDWFCDWYQGKRRFHLTSLLSGLSPGVPAPSQGFTVRRNVRKSLTEICWLVKLVLTLAKKKNHKIKRYDWLFHISFH